MKSISIFRSSLAQFSGLSGILVFIIFCLALLSNNFILSVSLISIALIIGTGGSSFPILSFALLVNLLYPSIGLAYFGQFGFFPGGNASTDYLNQAYGFQFVCTLVVFVIYTFCSKSFLRLDLNNSVARSFSLFTIKSRTLLLMIIFSYLPDWLGTRFNVFAVGGFGQIVQHIIAFRVFLLVYYFFVTFNPLKKISWIKCVLVILYAALSRSAVSGSGWAGTLILIAFAVSYLLTIDHVTILSLIRKQILVFLISIIGLVYLGTFGLVWEGGLKQSWRYGLSKGYVGTSTIERLGELSDNYQKTLEMFDSDRAIESLSARMSSGQGYFSIGIEDKESGRFDHQPGIFAFSALSNLVPRIFWADKPSLGGDSWMLRRFAGLQVAGDEEGASIGLGYAAQFFIEGGLIGVLCGASIFGLLMAFSHFVLRKASRSTAVGDIAFLVICVANFTTYDASYPKMLNSIVYQTLVFSVLLILMRKSFPMRSVWRIQSRWALIG